MTAAARSMVRTTAPRRPQAHPLEWLLIHLAFLAVSAFFLAPFLWLFGAAFDEKATAYIHWPSAPTFNNFIRIFTEHDFGIALGNSVFVSVATMLLVVVTVSLAGYSLSASSCGARTGSPTRSCCCRRCRCRRPWCRSTGSPGSSASGTATSA